MNIKIKYLDRFKLNLHKTNIKFLFLNGSQNLWHELSQKNNQQFFNQLKN